MNAHGTSTPLGDELEATAIKRAFGEHAYKMLVSSTKSMTGHLLGGAGGLEAAITVLALRDQIVPPTMNLDHPDEGCDLDFVPHTARKVEHGIRHVELVRLRRNQWLSGVQALDGVRPNLHCWPQFLVEPMPELCDRDWPYFEGGGSQSSTRLPSGSIIQPNFP